MAHDHDFEQQIYRSSQAAPLVDGLFATRADHALRRIEEVLAGRERKQPVNDTQRRFLMILRRHQGKPHAILQMQVCAVMKLDARQVRNLVEDLRVNFGVQIGASRDADGGGYYLITTDEEMAESTAMMQRQAVTMLRTVIAMRGGEGAVDELLKSLRRELTEEVK